MQIVKLNLIPGGVLPVCFASQNDTGRVIRFMLFEGENVFTLSGAESIELRLKKPDGSELVESVTNTGADYVDVVTTADTCDTAGASVGEIAITDGGDVLGSGNFGLFVESDAFDGGDIITQTASGAIATFETNIETAFVSLKSDINPVQDLHGYSKPWSGGGGKNKLNYEAWKTVSAYNGTAVFENNGVTLTATTNDCYTLSNADMRVPISEGETVTLSWQETANVNGAIYIFPNGTTSGMVYAQNASVKKLSYTATSGVTFITWRFGVQSAGVTAYYKNIQIEKGSTATAYEPYSNICPISGFSALNVTLADGDMQTVDTATVNFGQTVYGGVADVTNGKVTIERVAVDLGTLTWTKQTSVGGTKTYFRTASELADCKKNTNVGQLQGLICSNYAEDTWSHTVDTVGYDSTICTGWTNKSYIAINDQSKVSMSADDFKTAMSGVMLVYELATPIEIDTTPETLTAIVGQNNVYSDTNGDTEVEYYIEV